MNRISRFRRFPGLNRVLILIREIFKSFIPVQISFFPFSSRGRWHEVTDGGAKFTVSILFFSLLYP
ncbi:MAG: hypothetical protein CVV49_02600 [Spirochaetae bacterium HGW-Spirochaetae-5]|nr:MAG: hypothetical protein CVV49_02600 [Spirochaetae bacterium HGW-Spirochaetae-5]